MKSIHRSLVVASFIPGLLVTSLPANAQNPEEALSGAYTGKR